MSIETFHKLCPSQQEQLGSFAAYLDEPNRVLDSIEVNEQIVQRGAHWVHYDKDLQDACVGLEKEKFSGLQNIFARDIFCRGLYAAIPEIERQPSPRVLRLGDTLNDFNMGDVSVQVSSERGLTIFSLVRLDEEKDSPGIVFKCLNRDPTTLGIYRYFGTFKELQSIVETVATEFNKLKFVPLLNSISSGQTPAISVSFEPSEPVVMPKAKGNDLGTAPGG